LLDKVRGMIAGTYMKKSSKNEADILSLMAEETWMSAEEALSAGFIDAIDSEVAEEVALFDLSVFAKVPEKLQNHEDKEFNEREIERILRDAGCSRKQAKAILSEGFQPELRDAVPLEPLRDAVETPSPVIGSIEALLIQAEMIAPKQLKREV